MRNHYDPKAKKALIDKATQLRSNGLTMRQVATELNNLGFTTASGGKFTQNATAHLLYSGGTTAMKRLKNHRPETKPVKPRSTHDGFILNVLTDTELSAQEKISVLSHYTTILSERRA